MQAVCFVALVGTLRPFQHRVQATSDLLHGRIREEADSATCFDVILPTKMLPFGSFVARKAPGPSLAPDFTAGLPTLLECKLLGFENLTK